MPPLSLHLGTRYVRVNRMFCSWVGVSSEQLVGKRKFQDLLSVGGRIFHQTHFAPLLAMQGSISEVKLELLQADGSGLPIVINAMVQQQDGVKVHDLAAYVARDRDKYERELILSRKRLEELVAETRRLHEHAKDRALFAEQMIGIVSHDLRNPVSTIQTGAALLSRGPAVPGHDRLVSRILRASQRADQNAASVWDCSSSVKLRARTAELPTSILRLKPARLSAPRSAALREGQGPIFAPARALFRIENSIPLAVAVTSSSIRLRVPPGSWHHGRASGTRAARLQRLMSDPALHAFLTVLQRELGADDAYLQLGGRAADGEGRFFHAVAEATSLVVVFAEPPPDSDAVHERLAALSATFHKTLESAVAGVARPRSAMDYARQRLDEELTGLSERSGAARAFVFDFDSPVLWGASTLEERHAEQGKPLLERSVQLLRQRNDELKHAHGHTVRLTLDDDVEALVRPFAGLYVLALLFRDPLSEPIALGAILHAVGLIEKLVLALPPIDPEPGAKVIRLHGNSGSGKD